jgi:mono/diheme cytochrome c family protein
MSRDPLYLLGLALLSAVGGLVASLSCGSPPVAARLQEPAALPPTLPPTLSATGLYDDVATRRLAADVRPFTPQYPLWTDGAQKRRWIRLPPGTRIDATNPDRWVFPIGTRLWKEFAFDRPVETRLIERVADGSWRFATYVWDADGRDATLAPVTGVRGAHEIAPGVRHDVPGRLDCLACHGDRPSPVLGFSALQLSPDRDPLAPHAETPAPGSMDLASLRREGLIDEGPGATAAPRIAARTPRERAALGYLHGNCASCHRADGPLAELHLDFEALVAAGGRSRALEAEGRPARMRLPGASGTAVERLAPGRPAASLVYRRAASRQAVTQMPPLGTNLPDADALELLAAWIHHDLPASAPEPGSVSSLPEE